jgi:hypothetical protein
MLTYADPTPHVIRSEFSADGIKVLIFFDVQTTHGRPYRSRPGTALSYSSV